MVGRGVVWRGLVATAAVAVVLPATRLAAGTGEAVRHARIERRVRVAGPLARPSSVALAASIATPAGDPAAAAAFAPTATGRGLWVVDDDGTVSAGGDAVAVAPAPPVAEPVVGIAPTATGNGYWIASANGAVSAVGDAARVGGAPLALRNPVVGMSATHDRRGYWLVASDGGVFAFGDAPFFGSTGSLRLNEPIVGMAATPDGGGYWLVASDGGVFAFGDAPFFGSTGSLRLNEPIVGMAATPDGRGYWLVASDGGVFTYGDAHFAGSGAAGNRFGPAVGIANSTSDAGYWVLAADGTVAAFGDAPALPSLGPAAHQEFNVASTTIDVDDPTRPTPARAGIPGHPGRDLPTRVLYPAALNGLPLGGPWPVVAFAHGYNITPDDYMALLHTWAAAGYVVAAPFLPGERGDLPGPERGDIPEEPGDLSAVISALIAQAPPSPLAGLADPHRVAVAGHSDGGMAVAGMILGGLPRDTRIRAALILSGDTLGVAGQGNVPVFIAEGTADPINPDAADRLWAASSAPRALLVVLGGGHLAPFVTTGVQQDALRAATVDFLDAELSGSRDGLARLARDGDAPALTALLPNLG